MTLSPTAALGVIPQGLRQELLNEYEKITRNYRERRWEAAELDGGRMCEVVYTILNGHMQGNQFPTHAAKPSRFDDACKKLEQYPKATYSDSARLTIPRVLMGLYDLRNRRGVGHVGGDVSANHMDATYVLHAAQWIMAELVRLFHNISVDDATAVVDALVDRTVPVMWQVGDVTRILDTRLSLADGTLLILYSRVQGVHETDLARSLEQSNLANYRRVLVKLHKDRAIEYDRARNPVAVISPLGVKDVEERLLRST
jgi:hypothetical protein